MRSASSSPRATVPSRSSMSLLGVPIGVVHECLPARVVAEQIALGQGRALVRQLGLIPDQHHPAREALLAQGLRRLARRPGKLR